MPSDKDQIQRQDFELSFLFHPEMQPPDGSRGGLFKKGKSGSYINPYIEVAYQGYTIGRATISGQLRRFETTRSITPGLLTQVQNLVSGEVTVTEELVRAVLTVCSGSPA